MTRSLPEDHTRSNDIWWEPDETDTGPDVSAVGGTDAGLHLSRRAAWSLGLLLVGGAAAGATLLALSRDGEGGPGYIRGAGVLSLLEPAQRRPAPRLRGELLDGSAFDSARWGGSIIVVNFWGSWCLPCRAEAPDLVRVANETRTRGVQFLGVDIRDDRAGAQAFVRNYAVPYPSLFDPDGKIVLAFRGLPPNAVPTTIVVDRRGRIAARALGRITADALTGILAGLLQEV